MKKLFLLMFFISVNAYPQVGNKFFMGYIHDMPVFEAHDEYKLYVFKDSLEFLQSYPEGYSVVDIKDNGIVYSVKDHLVVTIKDVTLTYHDNLSFYAAIGNDYTVYASGWDSSIRILKEGKITKTGLKGWVVSADANYLYYTDEDNPEIYRAKANLYKVDIKTLKNPEKIAAGISGEYTVVFPDGKYVYDEVPYKRDFAPGIVSVDENKYQLLKITGRFGGTMPFYSLTDKCLVFYNPADLSMLKVPLPTRFPFEMPEK